MSNMTQDLSTEDALDFSALVETVLTELYKIPP